MEALTTLFGLAALIGGVWLMIIPVQILNEIKRQGAAREAEAVRITALLRILAGAAKAAPSQSAAAEPEPLQSMLDGRAKING